MRFFSHNIFLLRVFPLCRRHGVNVSRNGVNVWRKTFEYLKISLSFLPAKLKHFRTHLPFGNTRKLSDVMLFSSKSSEIYLYQVLFRRILETQKVFFFPGGLFFGVREQHIFVSRDSKKNKRITIGVCADNMLYLPKKGAFVFEHAIAFCPTPLPRMYNNIMYNNIMYNNIIYTLYILHYYTLII